MPVGSAPSFGYFVRRCCWVTYAVHVGSVLCGEFPLRQINCQLVDLSDELAVELVQWTCVDMTMRMRGAGQPLRPVT